MRRLSASKDDVFHDRYFWDEAKEILYLIESSPARLCIPKGPIRLKLLQENCENCISSWCNLCIAEKLEIMKADKDRSLNRRSELVSKCRHENQFYLCNFPPAIPWQLRSRLYLVFDFIGFFIGCLPLVQWCIPPWLVFFDFISSLIGYLPLLILNFLVFQVFILFIFFLFLIFTRVLFLYFSQKAAPPPPPPRCQMAVHRTVPHSGPSRPLPNLTPLFWSFGSISAWWSAMSRETQSCETIPQVQPVASENHISECSVSISTCLAWFSILDS